MTGRDKTAALVVALILAGGLLAGCAQTKLRLNDDFGQAVNQDLAAQIADPDASWKGPPPPSDGAHAYLMTRRYQTDTVTQPQALSSSSVQASSGVGSGTAGASSGTTPGSAVSTTGGQ